MKCIICRDILQNANNDICSKDVCGLRAYDRGLTSHPDQRITDRELEYRAEYAAG